MNKCTFKCEVMWPIPDAPGRVTRGWEVTPEGRVWPCCFFANAWDKRHMLHSDETEHPTEEDFNRVNDESATLLDDKRMMAIMEADPNWNMLSHHTLKEITEYEIFQSYIFTPGWNSDNPPTVCSKNCTIK